MEMPEWFPKALEEARAEDRRKRLAALPRVKFLWAEPWGLGPWSKAYGVMWDKNPDPPEGEYIYRRRFILRLAFNLSLETA